MTPADDRNLAGESRYSRQRLFTPVGDRGQARLSEARVGLVGCGALGSTIADHLVRAGLGICAWWIEIFLNSTTCSGRPCTRRRMLRRVCLKPSQLQRDSELSTVRWRWRLRFKILTRTPSGLLGRGWSAWWMALTTSPCDIC